MGILYTLCMGVELARAQTETWTGWIGSDSLDGTLTIGSTVKINSNTGPLLDTPCPRKETNPPHSPASLIGTTVKVLSGPSVVCPNGFTYYQVQFGGVVVVPPPATTQATFTCTPSFQNVQMATFVPAGATGMQFSVMNQGTAPMVITAVDISDPAFTVGGLTAPATIAPNATQNLTVKFVPTAVGKYAATIKFTANVTGGSFSMGVVGAAQ